MTHSQLAMTHNQLVMVHNRHYISHEQVLLVGGGVGDVGGHGVVCGCPLGRLTRHIHGTLCNHCKVPLINKVLYTLPMCLRDGYSKLSITPAPVFSSRAPAPVFRSHAQAPIFRSHAQAPIFGACPRASAF